MKPIENQDAKGLPVSSPKGAAPDFLQVIATHRHDASVLGGPHLRGPYFIVGDNGVLYKLVVTQGTLGVVVAGVA